MNATAIEHKFKTKLASIAALRITAEEIKNNANLYDSLIMSAYYYFAEVVLRSRKNYSLINSTGIERDEFLDDVLMHFLSKLDAILACPKEQLIPFTVKLANNKVIEKVRSYQRLYPVIYKKNAVPHTAVSGGTCPEDHVFSLRLINLLDDAAWEYIRDNRNIEQEYEDRDTALRILLILASSDRPLDVLSFLALNVIGWKNALLADHIIHYGYGTVLLEVLSDTADLFDVDIGIFRHIIEKNQQSPSTFDTKNPKQLSAVLSRSSYNAKAAVKKALDNR